MKSNNTLTNNAAFAAFCAAYPAYKKTDTLDDLRARDFAPFDATGEVYLDYTGGGRYGVSQIREHAKLLESNSFGNPHSINPPSMRSTELVEKARHAVLDFFQASEEEYCVIFTPNASGALRLVGESYPFQPKGTYLYAADNHNSVDGVREFARAKGAQVRNVPSLAPNLELDEQVLTKELAAKAQAPRLFAFAAQSNFSGVQHSLDVIETAQQAGWDVLLDAAAFVPTNSLNLKRYKPDFVALSFYKMFGWPTGVGALIARHTALAKLQRPWFSGGSIWAVSVQADWHVMAQSYEAFEDGTVNYLNLPAVTIGLQYLKKIGIETIHSRTICLTGWMLTQLQALAHKNGKPVCEVYGPKTIKNRGATIAFNFLNPASKIIDERIVDIRAAKQGIALRTGCFCNPGSGEAIFNMVLEKPAATNNEDEPQDFSHYLQSAGLQSAGAIRLSFGEFSNFADAEAFMQFARTFCNDTGDDSDLPDRKHC